MMGIGMRVVSHSPVHKKCIVRSFQSPFILNDLQSWKCHRFHVLSSGLFRRPGFESFKRFEWLDIGAFPLDGTEEQNMTCIDITPGTQMMRKSQTRRFNFFYLIISRFILIHFNKQLCNAMQTKVSSTPKERRGTIIPHHRTPPPMRVTVPS